MRSMGPLTSLVMAVPLVVGGLPVAADELDDDHHLSLEFETPHTDWAQPYALGKIRALFFSNGRGTEPREMVELMQRFDIEADAVYHIRVIDRTEMEWLGGEAGDRRMLRLLEKPYDVYIFQGIPPGDLTPEQQYKVFKPVTEGAGLVLIGTDDERILKPERGLDKLPDFLAPAQPEAAFTIVEGRGVRMPGRPDLDYHVGWEVEYDYWQERLGRAVLWAAGKEPEMDLAVGVEPQECRRGTPGQPAIALTWSRNHRRGTKLEIALRRWDGERSRLIEKGIPLVGRLDGETRIEPQEPWPPAAGEYHLDVRALSKRGVEGWATAPFTVTSERTVEEVVLDSEWGEVGQVVSGMVRLAGPPVEDERLRVRLMDRRGRILARRDMAVAGDDMAFSFPIEPWMPMLLRVEAVILSGEQEVASAYEFFRVTKRNRGQFNFLMWDYPKGTLGPYGEESLAKLGVSIHLAGGNPPLQAAAYDIAWVPYTTRILAPKDEKGYMKPVCWNDEPAVQQWVDGIVSNYADSRGHGVFVYSLGDETVTRGSCLHPACLEAYRRYLEQEYGAIEALNASWGTQFESFGEVTLSQPDDNDEAEALRSRNYPRWYDRQAFKCHNFVQLCKRFGEAYAELDPEARTGFEGAGRFRDGDDIDLIVRTNGFWSPYPGPADEVIRSIAPRDFPRANWMGYTKDADSLLSKYWRMVTRGTDAVWWWRWDALGRFNGFLAPHLGPFPATKDLSQDTQVVRDGLGTLLMNSEMLDDGIAILYSMPSAYATRLEAGPSYGSYRENHTAWHRAIRELGLQFRYVTDRMLRLGEFQPERYKVLILPRAEAIGPQEAKVIRAFAEGGGTVIADVRPGLFDGHCKPLEKGHLDDLFGVRWEGNREALTAQVRIEGEWRAGFVSLACEEARVDPGVHANRGQAALLLGKVPVCISRRVGEGGAVLLNFAMSSFPDISKEQTPEGSADFLRVMLATAGVEPQVRLRDGRGRRVRNVEVVRWQNGDIELMALFRESGKRQRARVRLPSARHVYDLRRHKALGRVKRFRTEIIPSRATFFALLPKAAPGPAISLDRPRVAPGTLVTARLMVPGADGLHALRIRARTPEGTPAEWLDQVVIVGREAREVALPIAFNDAPGQWTISAVDLYTDKAVGIGLRVR
ncbi:MAG: beta-galactosidase trimerization domain-containing protein [Armatimonadota bacterium]